MDYDVRGGGDQCDLHATLFFIEMRGRGGAVYSCFIMERNEMVPVED